MQIYHTTFDQNTGAYGGALRTEESRIDYGMNLTFTLNTATYDGGAFYSYAAGSNRTLYDRRGLSRQQGPQRLPSGGLFARNNVTVSLYRATVDGNQVKHDGAGLYARDATILINSGAVTDNKVDGTDDYSSGGGLYITGTSKLTLSNAQIDRNQIDYLGNGGGVHLYGTTATLNNVTLNNNKATNAAAGGGSCTFRMDRPPSAA
ncbi:MAG: hypothetical protein U0559_04955 [Anaerolineae bacterium]